MDSWIFVCDGFRDFLVLAVVLIVLLVVVLILVVHDVPPVQLRCVE